MRYFKAAFGDGVKLQSAAINYCEFYKGVEIVAIEYDDGMIVVTKKKKDDHFLHTDCFQPDELYSLEQVLQDYIDDGATIVDKKL